MAWHRPDGETISKVLSSKLASGAVEDTTEVAFQSGGGSTVGRAR